MTTADPSAEFEPLLRAARGGDADALDRLFRRYYPRVEELVHVGLVRDLRRGRPWLLARFSTGDIVQDVFRRLLQDLGAFAGNDEDSFISYLVTSARHRLLDEIRYHEAARRDGRRTADGLDEQLHARAASTPASDAADAEEVEVFREVLETFPERERYLLRARIEQEVHFKDLAAQLGYSSGHAARRAFYAAQAQLVVRLKQRSGSPPE
ncbi:MAG: sigma-70 family RNA polymerase sigma factor [Planctomycetota bacterium]